MFKLQGNHKISDCIQDNLAVSWPNISFVDKGRAGPREINCRLLNRYTRVTPIQVHKVQTGFKIKIKRFFIDFFNHFYLFLYLYVRFSKSNSYWN